MCTATESSALYKPKKINALTGKISHPEQKINTAILKKLRTLSGTTSDVRRAKMMRGINSRSSHVIVSWVAYVYCTVDQRSFNNLIAKI